MSGGKLKVLDLFSGIGGFSLGLERTGGFETVAFCEIEPFPRKVLAKHWPGVPCYDDVRELPGEQVGPVDAIVGGWPCQDISVAGDQLGIHLGSRSSLIWEVIRLVTETWPQAIILENVAAFTGTGSLVSEYSVRCVCGWSSRWRGLPVADRADERGVQAPEFFVSACGGDGRQGGETADALPPAARWDAAKTELAQPAAPRPNGLEYAHTGSTAAIGSDASTHDRKAGASATLHNGVPADLGEAGELRARLGHHQGLDARTKQDGTAAEVGDWLVCASCGRELAEPTERHVRTSGLGDVLRALAGSGYHAEWRCISAAEVGAPHFRDRFWLLAYPAGVGFEGQGRYFEPIHPTPDAFREADPFVASVQRDAVPYVCRRHDGVPKGLAQDGLKALGNAVVPQIPELIGRAILASLQEQREAA
jgi:site-specific DNA-cytosine methylase